MRYGFVIDQDRCIGCHACTVACKAEHRVPLGVNRTWVKYIEKGEFPYAARHFGVLRCNHCDDAPCIEICPTVALFRRSDGIVDFDKDRCIGCKSCMQACPYDALYIDPGSNTAAKCNFCAHRVETGLKPACEIVCPTTAIISGDLDDPASKASRIVATQKVVLRKPEKGTHPKLFYVGIEGDLLQPTMMEPESSHLWGDKPPGEDWHTQPADGKRDASDVPGIAREVYDVSHPAPWGRMIASYLWTKSVAAGALLVAALLHGAGYGSQRLLDQVSPALALLFTAITSGLLVLDLKRPERFLYLLIKPNFSSWLVWGGYILLAYGGAATLWLAAGLVRGAVPVALIWSAAALAVGAACYSAFLFAQAKGRDLWQSPLFLWHLLAQAVTAGTAALILLATWIDADFSGLAFLSRLLGVSLLATAALTLGEVWLTPVTEDTRRATELLARGRLSRTFWGGMMGAGVLAPLALLFWAADPAAPVVPLRWLAAVLALLGLWIFEDLWIRAGQAPRLS